jgi:UDP-N-acetylglucosamine/UDP-N-acetyl-alpha-D-glucosaminouronate 4-epimerase
MAHYLVTGGAGFIGSNIVEALLVAGERVRVLDDFATGKRESIAPFLSKIDLIEGSLARIEDCRRATRDVDYVFHQGALPSVPKSIELPRETNEANVTGTLNLLVAARDARVKRLVFAASSSAYGDTPVLPKVETMTPTPKSPYAIQKLTGELYCRVFYEQFGLETVAIRYFNVFGPRQDPASQYSAVIPRFITAYLRDEEPVIFGDGTQSRDFTYVDNIVHANLLACKADKACAGQVMNVACGERITLLELARVIREDLGRTKLPRHEAPRPGDVMHSHADIELARKLLGFTPRVLFEAGMKKTIAWYKENRG